MKTPTPSKGIRLYNLIFPVFMIMLLSPVLWVIMLVGNFLIDTLVLWIGCKVHHIPDFVSVWKKAFVKMFLFGFLSDWLGCLANSIFFMFIQPALGLYPDGLDPYNWPGCALYALPALLITALLLYWFNRKFTFSKTAIPAADRRKLALEIAILTAPYAMMIPMDLWM